jgi:hypothetical protein
MHKSVTCNITQKIKQYSERKWIIPNQRNKSYMTGRRCSWRQYVSPRRWYPPVKPHDVTTQKKNIDVFTAVRIWKVNAKCLTFFFLILEAQFSIPCMHIKYLVIFLIHLKICYDLHILKSFTVILTFDKPLQLRKHPQNLIFKKISFYPISFTKIKSLLIWVQRFSRRRVWRWLSAGLLRRVIW